MGCHALLQEIFQTQGWKLHLLHWQVDSLPAEPPVKTSNHFVPDWLTAHLHGIPHVPTHPRSFTQLPPPSQQVRKLKF